MAKRSTSKFDNRLAELVYELSLDGGADDEVGSSGTWAGIMRDGVAMARAIRKNAKRYDLDDEDERELSILNRLAGVIIYEETSGSVGIDEFASSRQLEKHWEKVVDDLSPEDNDEDEDD